MRARSRFLTAERRRSWNGDPLVRAARHPLPPSFRGTPACPRGGVGRRGGPGICCSTWRFRQIWCTRCRSRCIC